MTEIESPEITHPLPQVVLTRGIFHARFQESLIGRVADGEFALP